MEIALPQDELSQAHVYINGRVQGVNYRFYTRQQAIELGLHGWVRNVRDGRVEAVFQGEQSAVLKMLKWCELGPPSARVTDVEVDWQTPLELYSSFEIKFW
jgi:acylphosphatase